MPIRADLDGAPGFIRWTVDGDWPSIEELRELRLRLVANGQLTSETRALIDLRMVKSVPRYDAIELIVAAALKDGGLPHRRAYLVGSAVQYGVVRQFQAVADGSPVTLAVFTVEPEAMAWLMERAV